MVMDSVKCVFFDFVGFGRMFGMLEISILWWIVLLFVFFGIWDMFRISFGWVWIWLVLVEFVVVILGLGYCIVVL